MTNLDDLKNTFSRKLDRQIEQHEARFEQDLAEFRDTLLDQAQSFPRDRAPGDLTDRSIFVSAPHVSLPGVHTLLDLRGSTPLVEIDKVFTRIFELQNYYPVSMYSYPTVYCETLEEFYGNYLDSLDHSPQAKQNILAELVANAEETAERSNGGGVFGVNLPGRGCYLNGWLFAYGQDISPRQVLGEPELLRAVLSTAAHEKLGHGFLGTYSAMGVVKKKLNLAQVEIARRFGLRSADDPISTLRTHQHQLLFLISQLLEEGWATWIETFITAEILGAGQRPRHSLAAVVKAVEALPRSEAARERNALLGALQILFGPDETTPEELHQASMVIAAVGRGLEDYFMGKIGQPIAYAVGELLMVQAETNLGTYCLPYAALIAANVTFDPDKISLSDLDAIIHSNYRLHPDARLAALSRLVLDERDSLQELTARAEADLSLSVPKELKFPW